jgi:hypothetical protein
MKDRISYVIGRERNVVRVDFDQQPEPPTPMFPGAAALRKNVPDASLLNAISLSARKGGKLKEATLG